MIVGVTGGIGSGKSEVSHRFAQLGITVVDADIVAREVVSLGNPALAAISQHFGQHILNADGSLDRRQLRTLIFENHNEKLWLENLLHPIIRKEIMAQLLQSTSSYSLLSSPLLFETKQNELVDRVLVIDATEDLQLQRASARDKNNKNQLQKIMATQLSRSERCAKANDIIENHNDLNELDVAVKKLHTFYMKLAEQPSAS
jgi:dephospho-CoA kinase